MRCVRGGFSSEKPLLFFSDLEAGTGDVALFASRTVTRPGEPPAPFKDKAAFQTFGRQYDQRFPMCLDRLLDMRQVFINFSFADSELAGQFNRGDRPFR